MEWLGLEWRNKIAFNALQKFVIPMNPPKLPNNYYKNKNMD
jgi:hypothetical protein